MSLVVALMLGLVLGLGLGQWWLPDASTPTAGQARLSDGTDRTPADLERAGRQASRSVPLASCAKVYAAQARVLHTVGPAMSQWEVHVGAMNKLVVGAITLPQATQFWNRTREGAARNVEAFGAARHEFEQRTARCPPPAEKASDRLRRCSAVVAARDLELRRATAALGTWRTHVHHMEMLRRGEMTPEQATQMWLASWQHGTAQLDAYRDAARGAHRVASSDGEDAGGADAPCGG